jgi:hypothetical protein
MVKVPPAGNILKFTEKVKIRTMASQKLGTEIPAKAKKLIQ